MNRIRTVLLFLLTLSLVVESGATAVSGRATVWSYLRDDSVDHAQVVPQLSVNLYQLGHKNLSFQTTLRGYYDFRNGESSDEQLRIQRAVFVYAPRKSRWELRGGQQWLTEGVGRGNMAGLWVRYQLCPRTTLTAYGGARLPHSISLADGMEDEGITGGLHTRTRFNRYSVGLSYTYTGKEGDILFHGAGVDGTGRFGRNLTLRARLHMNLEQSAVETAQLAGIWTAHEKVQVTAELRHHTPRIFEDSYFTRFLEDVSTHYVRSAVRWNFFRCLYAKGGVTGLFTEEDLLYKARLGLGIPELELGYAHYLTAGEGDMDGFYGQFFLRPIRSMQTFGGFDFSKGSYSEIRPNSESQSIYAGAAYDLIDAINVSGRVEHIRDFERSDDWRGLFSLSAKFSTLR